MELKLGFDNISNLVKNINYLLQKTCNFKIKSQQSWIFKNHDYFKKESEYTDVLEQQVAGEIIENKKNEYHIGNYCKTYYTPQTAVEIKADKEQRDVEFLETATKYYSEKIKSTGDIENEGKRNLFLAAPSASESMIADDKIIVESWFVDYEFCHENVVISSSAKTYIDDLIKKTKEKQKIEIPFKTFKSEPETE